MCGRYKRYEALTTLLLEDIRFRLYVLSSGISADYDLTFRQFALYFNLKICRMLLRHSSL